MSDFSFEIIKKDEKSLARVGVIKTPHGEIKTPAFVAVGTQATVKSISPENVKEAKIDVVLANTYHLYLKPGHKIIEKAGGLHSFMNWQGPTMTDSGGFQVFSLGLSYGNKKNKVVKKEDLLKIDSEKNDSGEEEAVSLVKIDEDGVDFRSVVDGSSHRFTPEISMQIQHAIGADITFAFDECPPGEATKEYQIEAMERTHRWAKRSIEEFKKLQANSKKSPQALFGIVQGGRFEDLRKESAKVVGAMDFDGFGIGGSFNKEDIGSAVRFVNETLPYGKPKHLLGIGEPEDIISAIESGCDTFDCVAPTRMARNGGIHTKEGRINILNAKYREDMTPIEADCDCYTCRHYSKAYVAHLFRSKEMFAATLATIHNLRFLTRLTNQAREAILSGEFDSFKKNFRY
jgi:queuine tRNA-ribosyltransferase